MATDLEPTTIGNPDAFDQRAAADYLMYRSNSSFGYDAGVVVLPVASRTSKTVTVRLHGGYGMRKVDVTAAKRGAPPILPAAVDTDKDTLISCEINVPLPAVSGNSATFDWVATGSYLFVTTHADGARVPGRDYLPAGQYPFPTPLQDRAVEALSESGDGVRDVGAQLMEDRTLIPTSNFVWPFAVLPPAFFNPILLRDSDEDSPDFGGGEF